MSTPSRNSPLRRWGGRAALAVGVPVAFFLALEGGLRLAGVGRPASFLIPDALPGYYRTNPDFVSLFLPGSFDLRPLNWRVRKEKPANSLRVVLLGESAAQGVPAPTFGMAEMLRAELRRRYPDREVEVLNAGIVAINSHVVDRVMRDLAPFKPDIVIVYMGNNEVVGPYGPGCAYLSSMPPLWAIRASVFVRSTRTGQWLGSLVGKLGPHGTTRAEWGGMSMFVKNAVPGDDPRLETVYRNFESNLSDIVSVSRGAGAKTIVCTVASNLKECAPFLSIHQPALEGAALSAWTDAFEEGRAAWKLGDGGHARASLEKALALDPHYADTLFMLASIDSATDGVKARGEYIDAEHWDALRFRPDPRINEVIRKVTKNAGPDVALSDEALALGSDPTSASEPSGHRYFWEHVHFTVEGNAAVAQDLSRAIEGFLPAGKPANSAGSVEQWVGYGWREHLPVLERIEALVRKPPFTNQLTYPLDQARLLAEIEEARRLRAGLKPRYTGIATDLTPGPTRDDRKFLQDAIDNDPDNPLLAGLMESLQLDRGDYEGAFANAQKAEAAQPWDFGAEADIASILLRMGKTDEALGRLDHAAQSGGDMDQLAPAYVDFYSRTGRFADGIRFLDGALHAHPNDRRLALARASLLAAKGDVAGAETGFRALLQEDPSSEEAQEGLVGALLQAGDPQGANAQTLAVADAQQRNQANDLRAAKLYDDRMDAANAANYLEAAVHSGPVTSTVELTLALKDYQLHRMNDVLLHLAEARAIAAGEGNPQTSAGIANLIDRMRGEAGWH